MKKHITRLLFAALLLLALCIGASAAGTSGKCGPSAYWSFDSSTGTLTISGSGAMNDYEYGNDYPWMDYGDGLQYDQIREKRAEYRREGLSRMQKPERRSDDSGQCTDCWQPRVFRMHRPDRNADTGKQPANNRCRCVL